MSKTAYKDMSQEELKTELLSLTREQFNLRIQKATSEFKKPHLFKQIRKNIARVKTFLAKKAGN